MAKTKVGDLSAMTIKKGAAAPAAGVPQRSAVPAEGPKKGAGEGSALVPFNFRVPAEWREEFERYAFNSTPRRKMVDVLKDAFQALKEKEGKA